MSWQAPEFEYRARGVSWYWTTIIIAAAMVAFAVWQKNFLFGLFVIIAEMLALIWSTRTPRTIPFSISDRELVIGERKHYLMSELESFSVDEPIAPAEGVARAEFAELAFHFKGKLHMPILVCIPTAQLAEARKNLQQVIREIEHQPTFIDSLEKWIGF